MATLIFRNHKIRGLDWIRTTSIKVSKFGFGRNLVIVTDVKQNLANLNQTGLECTLLLRIGDSKHPLELSTYQYNWNVLIKTSSWSNWIWINVIFRKFILYFFYIFPNSTLCTKRIFSICTDHLTVLVRRQRVWSMTKKSIRIRLLKNKRLLFLTEKIWSKIFFFRWFHSFVSNLFCKFFTGLLTVLGVARKDALNLFFPSICELIEMTELRWGGKVDPEDAGRGGKGGIEFTLEPERAESAEAGRSPTSSCLLS